MLRTLCAAVAHLDQNIASRSVALIEKPAIRDVLAVTTVASFWCFNMNSSDVSCKGTLCLFLINPAYTC